MVTTKNYPKGRINGITEERHEKMKLKKKN